MSKDFKWTEAELRQHLNDAVGSLRRAAEAYDGGEEGASKDLAVKIQLLVYDHGSSTSLLTQLGRHDLRYFSTKNILAGTKETPQFPLVIASIMGKKSSEATTQSAVYRPVYDLHHGISDNPWMIPKKSHDWNHFKFSKWWSDYVLILSRRESFSRCDLVLMHANREGGRHLASKYMRPEERSLIRQESMRFKLSGIEVRPKNGIQYGCIRQIAYELQLTLDAELSDLLDKPATAPLRPRTLLHPDQGPLRPVYDKRELQKLIHSYEERGEGDSPEADEFRRLHYWST